MKVMMFLMVAAVALLVGPAVASPTPRLNENGKRIIDLASEYNASLSKEYFVEEVVKGECGALFFCKVHDILHQHQHYGKLKKEKELVRNLDMYIDSIPKIANCTKLLKEVTSTGYLKPIPPTSGKPHRMYQGKKPPIGCSIVNDIKQIVWAYE